jgi:hypothetical protein
MRRSFALLALLLIPALVSAQGVPQPQAPAVGTGRLTIEGLYGRNWITENLGANRAAGNAFGGRVSWRLGTPVTYVDEGTWMNRTSVGAFWKQTPMQHGVGGDFRIAHYGVLIDHLPFGVWRERFEPMLSTELGTFRADVRNTRGSSGIFNKAEGTPRFTSFAPGVGLRVSLVDRFGVRFDGRDVIVSESGNYWHVPELAGALSVRW